MEANELRVDNWFRYIDHPKIKPERRGEEVQCIADDILYLTELEDDDLCPIEPIPLTEDWLIKFGFKSHHNEYYNDTLAIWEDGFLWYYSIYPRREMWDKLSDMSAHRTGHYLKCVHQLQNLYFALTGEELKIK